MYVWLAGDGWMGMTRSSSPLRPSQWRRQHGVDGSQLPGGVNPAGWCGPAIPEAVPPGEAWCGWAVLRLLM